MISVQSTEMMLALHQLVLFGNGAQLTIWVHGDQAKASRIARMARCRLEKLVAEIKAQAGPGRDETGVGP